MEHSRWNGLPRKAVAFLFFAVAYVFVVIGSQVFISNVFQFASFHTTVEVLTLVMSNAWMFGNFLYYRRATRSLWIREETERFLKNRSRQSVKSSSQWRKRFGRGMLWVPTVIVLLTSLFFPEVLGIISHLFWNRNVGSRNLEVPQTWIIADDSTTSRDGAILGGSIWVIVGKGIGRVGVAKYWRKEEPVSEMTFSSYSTFPHEPRSPALSMVLSKEELPFGDEALVCWDIVPFAKTRPTRMDANFAEIVCNSTMNDFHASFSGWRTDLSKFYRLLRGSRQKSENIFPAKL